MADNIANIPSSVADSTPQATLGSAYTAASGSLTFAAASKPSYWPSAPYRVTVLDSTNGDITFRVSVDSGWPTVTAAVVEGSDHNIASGASAEHLGPLTAGGFDDRVNVVIAAGLLATDAELAAHESDTSSVHGITDTTKQVPVKIFQPGLRSAAQAATTANITLSGTQTVDTVALGVNDVCLVKDQTNTAENGLYDVNAGAWTRHANQDTANEIYTGIVLVLGGSVNISKVFATSNLTPPSVGVDAITYVEINDSTSVPDTTPANRMALDLVSFLFGPQTVGGIWTMGEVTMDQLTTANAIISTVADGIVTFLFSTADVDAVTGVGVEDTAGGTYMFMSGTGKISTSLDLPLELKSGFGSSTSQSYIYLNGGQRVKMVYKSANYTVDIGDNHVIYTTLAATRTDTLPLLSTIPDGWWCVFGDGTTAGAAGTYNLIVNEHATDGGSEVARLATNNHFVKVKKINGAWWRGPYELWTRTA